MVARVRCDGSARKAAACVSRAYIGVVVSIGNNLRRYVCAAQSRRDQADALKKTRSAPVSSRELPPRGVAVELALPNRVASTHV